MNKPERAKKVEYNGILFDSTLELKFTLLIEEKCEFIYHPLSIWYDRNDLSKEGKQVCPHKYEPDFLVRKVKDNSAHLIEIKNSQFVNARVTKIKEFVAKRYIKSKGYDWTYAVLTEKDFSLNLSLQQKLNEIIKSRKFVGSKHRMLRMEATMMDTYVKKNKVPFRTIFELEESDHLLYVKKGIMRERC